MDRRFLLKFVAGLPLVGALFGGSSSAASRSFSRVRPGEPGWPADDARSELGHGSRVG